MNLAPDVTLALMLAFIMVMLLLVLINHVENVVDIVIEAVDTVVDVVELVVNHVEELVRLEFIDGVLGQLHPVFTIIYNKNDDVKLKNVMLN